MKLSVSYNLFDSEEWLEESVSQVRDYSDFVSVVFQEVSNFGDKCTEEAIPILNSLLDKGLIDTVHPYSPDKDIMQQGRGDFNELIKRRIGLRLGRESGCTHHMSMDADELYKKRELEYVIREVEKNDYDYCACQTVTYYKEPCYVLDPPAEYYVPLMCQISDKTFQLGYPFPVEADPTRRMATKKFMAFGRDEIQMHHMSYVRNDIRKKLFNSSSKVNWEARMSELVVERWKNWKYGDKALLAGKSPVECNTMKVERIFSYSQ